MIYTKEESSEASSEQVLRLYVLYAKKHVKDIHDRRSLLIVNYLIINYFQRFNDSTMSLL